MIYQNMLLHNISELHSFGTGQQLFRFPQQLREQLNPYAQRSMPSCCGVELRFRLKSESASIHLSFADAENMGEGHRFYEVYYGGFQGGMGAVGKDGATITVRLPENIDTLRMLTEEHHLPYAADVIRIMLPYGGHCILSAVEGEIEPPTAADLPPKRLLIHGSSITHGSSAQHPGATYAARTAAMLGMDLVNLGIAGGCMLEPQMADYIAGRTDWDVGMFELGINFQWDADKEAFRSPAAYQERVDYFLPAIAKAHADKWIFCTAFYQGFPDFHDKPDGMEGPYREILKRKIAELNLPKLVYLQGEHMMPNGVTGLSADLIHPSASGAVDISNSLTDMIRKYI